MRRERCGALLPALVLTTVLVIGCTTTSGAPLAATASPGGAGLGVFLASDGVGVRRLAEFETWLGREVTVGRTYLPGGTWADVEGPGAILDPWTAWRAERPGRTLVLNVPLLVPNEADVADTEVADLLARGVGGEFDEHFRVLAERLVARNAAGTILVLAWEMNGETYTSRCGPDPVAWREYWRRVVGVMRAVPGQQFRFDFTPSRGTDDVPWPECYPGDDVVDIIGMDTYDQAPGDDFGDYVSQPLGLQEQADFAADRGKPISFPEWGLFRYGDDAEFVRAMYAWITSHDVVYQSISDYCPHGVWQCEDNPQASRAYRELFGGAVRTPEGDAPGPPR